MKYLIILSLFIPVSYATLYGQVNAGKITASSKTGVDYDGNSVGLTVGKRFAFLGIEVGGKQKKYGLKQIQGSLTKADYVDQEVSVGLRLFLGRFITGSAGASVTNTQITSNSGSGDIVTDEKNRKGYYYEGGLKLPIPGGPTLFANYRKDVIDDIESVTLSDNIKVDENQSINIGLSHNF